MAQCIFFENIEAVVILPFSMYGFSSGTVCVLCNKLSRSNVSHTEGQITLQNLPIGIRIRIVTGETPKRQSLTRVG